MNVKKRILSVLMVVVMLFTVAPMSGLVDVEWFSFDVSAEGSEVTEGDYTYTVSDGEATISRVDQTISGDVVIPDTLGGYTVTMIGYYAFYYCRNLTSVTIPESVTTIEAYAFNCCDSLTSVTLSENITAIGEYAFYLCYSLTNITVDTDNQFYSSDSFGVLYNKNKTELIQYPIGNTRDEFIISDSVITIGDGAFYGCDNITSVIIPDSVTTIGVAAFRGCDNITNVTIPDSVITIGNSAFFTCENLKDITIGNSVTTIEGCAFEYCYDLTSVSIGNSVSTIGAYAFDNCKSLSEIIIPDNVTSIGTHAFSFCTALERVILPAGLETIGDYAFYDCENLTCSHFCGIQEQWGEIMIGERNICLADTVHTASDGNSDSLCDTCGYEISTETITTSPTETELSTTETPPLTAEPIAPTEPIGAPTTDREEELTTAKSTTTKKEATTTTAPSTTASTTTEKEADPVVKAKKPAKVKIKKPTSKKKKQIVVSWNKVKNANGYQLAYSTSKKFKKKHTKTKLIKKAKTTKTTLKKLKSGKKYFIRIRAYKTVNNKKVYGAYSKVMSVKVK